MYIYVVYPWKLYLCPGLDHALCVKVFVLLLKYVHDLQGMVCNTDITACIVGLPVLLKLEMILLISCQF